MARFTRKKFLEAKHAMLDLDYEKEEKGHVLSKMLY
jgi:hypothetical protein